MAYFRCSPVDMDNLPDTFTIKLPVQARGDFFNDNKTVCALTAQSVSGTVGNYDYVAAYPGTYAQNGTNVVSTSSTYSVTFTKTIR